MAANKWFPGLNARFPVEEAGNVVIQSRLQGVRRTLRKASRKTAGSIEPVHQLRVATRRASAALRVFRDCLPPEVCDSIRKKLKVIRRTASQARDWDVFVENLREASAVLGKKDQPALDLLLGYALSHRLPAQTELACLSVDEIDPLLDAASLVVQTPQEGMTLGDLARPMLLALLDEFEQATSERLSDLRQLHQARITGKRLRYTMEILAGCFPRDFRRDYYPMIEELQEILGEVNDSYVAVEFYQQLAAGLRTFFGDHARRYLPTIRKLSRRHDVRIRKGLTTFKAWLKGWRSTGLPGLLALLHYDPDQSASEEPHGLSPDDAHRATADETLQIEGASDPSADCTSGVPQAD